MHLPALGFTQGQLVCFEYTLKQATNLLSNADYLDSSSSFWDSGTVRRDVSQVGIRLEQAKSRHKQEFFQALQALIPSLRAQQQKQE